MWDSLADINKVDWARGGFGVKDAAPGWRRHVDDLVAALIDAAGAHRQPGRPLARADRQGRRACCGGSSPACWSWSRRGRGPRRRWAPRRPASQLEGNNPIKFARSPEQALAQLLSPPEPGFMEADRAVEDAYLDLQSHQVATLKAIPGALRATLDRFSPGSIRRRAATNLGLLAQHPARRSATPPCGAITSASSSP